MKIIRFEILTKDNTTCYDTVQHHLAKTTYQAMLNKEKAIDLDFLAELKVDYEINGVIEQICVGSCDVSSLMEWLKENHPGIHALVPSFRIDMFQALADKMGSSSGLIYTAVEPDQDLEYQFGCFPDPDDFVPELDTVEESVEAIRKNGFYTELYGYPDTPVGFWGFYGLDFQSLLNHVITE